MVISELIAKLEALRAEIGDAPILMDDTDGCPGKLCADDVAKVRQFAFYDDKAEGSHTKWFVSFASWHSTLEGTCHDNPSIPCG